MKDAFIARVRREQTRQELDLVSSGIKLELEQLFENDPSGLHQTQLEGIQSILITAATDLHTNLDRPEIDTLEVEEVYDLCRDYDEAIIWLQRLWVYLRDKFRQRHGDEEVANLLRSADEVVWSCFHGVLSKALGQHGPAPLTYIEPEYSPATIQTDKPLPINLRLTADLEFLDECLQSLPIPVLRLPPSCVSAPWWLVYVGHEVGHHVQYALEVVEYFRLGLSSAAQAQGFSAAEADDSWGRWGEEIFADFFSLMMMGQWALLAMAEAETGKTVKMVKRKSTYPSPVIRLALMKRAAEELGLDVADALLGLDLKEIAAADETASKDYQVVEDAVSFAFQPLPGQLGTLKELCSFNSEVFSDGGKVSGWASVLSSKGELQLDLKTMQKLEAGREIVCGSLRAWSSHSAGTHSGDPEADYKQRKDKRIIIKSNTIAALLLSGPRDTRAGGAEASNESEKKGKALADLLRQTVRRSQ